jgi:CheY-like chemotaxis protein
MTSLGFIAFCKKPDRQRKFRQIFFASAKVNPMQADPFVPSLQPQHPDRRPAFVLPALPPQQEILVVEAESFVALHIAALRGAYRLVTTTDVAVANQYLNRTSPALVIADLDSHGPAGVDLCHAAKSLRTPATVLMTASQTTSVPDVLLAGCDAILLKPFAANLLYARIGRLLRSRVEQLRIRARRADVASDLSTRPEPPLATTNRAWPDTACPSCEHGGAVSFEFSSHRRSWYACLACKKVWLGKRQE